MKTASILIVEDDEALRTALEKSLREAFPGALARFEATGEAAGDALLELHRSGRGCTLVVADVLLKGRVTGVDLLVSCRTRFPELPFLLTSGLPEEFARGLLEGASVPAAILPKPFTLKQFREKCSELVARRAKAA